MITFAILILIVAKALPGLNTHISSIHVTRITSIVFLFASALSLNSLNLESIGSGIGLYSGLFQVTTISQLIEIFLFMVGGGILIAWPQIKQINYLPYQPKALFLGPLSLSHRGLASVEKKKDAPATQDPKDPRVLNINSTTTSNVVGPASLEVGEKNTLLLLRTDKHSTDYSLVVLFSSLGSSLLISSYDLISIYLSIELQSFGLYVLSTLYRDSETSTSAGLKYFLLGGLSSCIILLGIGIIYSYTGTTSLESLYIINSIIDVNQQYFITYPAQLGTLANFNSIFSIGSSLGVATCNLLALGGEGATFTYPGLLQSVGEVGSYGISLGLILIFIGFLFKIAAAPLHNWSPDVYDGTPTIVTTWLTIIPKIAILFILLELQVNLGSFGLLGIKTIIVNSGYIIKTLLLISSTLSLIIGSLLGLAQIRIKRLLAYSTISHIGFILLALAVNTEQSIDSFIFYIIQYTITNLNIFLVILGLTYCLSLNSNHLPLGLHNPLGSWRNNPSPTYGGLPLLAPYFFMRSFYKKKSKGQLLAQPTLRRGRVDSLPEDYSYSTLRRFLRLEEKTANKYYSTPLLSSSPCKAGGEGGYSYGGSYGEKAGADALHKDISFISEFKGLFFTNPLLSLSLAISLFSMAGIPPLLGFFSKQLVLYSALQNGYYFISFIAIIVSVISCSYYLQIIKLLFTPSPNKPLDLYFFLNLKNKNYSCYSPRSAPIRGGSKAGGGLGQKSSTYSSSCEAGVAGVAVAPAYATPATATAASAPTEQEDEIILTNTHSYLISTLTFSILLFFIKPSLILNSTQLLSLSLFYI